MTIESKDQKLDLARAESVHGRKSTKFLIWSLVVLSFLPYAAIPAGESTNIPFASCVGLAIILLKVRSPFLVVAWLTICVVPAVPLAISVIVFNGPGDWRGLGTWAVYVTPLIAFAWAASIESVILTHALRVGILLTSLYVLIQKAVFLGGGGVPLAELYSMPGYAATDQVLLGADELTRPFGLFPEPSFAAGTLTLATMSLILLCAHETSIRVIDAAIVVTSCFAIFLTGSGTAVICLAGLAWLALSPRMTPLRAMLILVPALVLGSIGGSIVLEARNSILNFSWYDRPASIVSSLEYSVDHPRILLFGAGRGAAAVLYAANAIPVDSVHFNPVRDIYSVLFRMIFELGLFIGGSLIAIAIAAIFMAFRVRFGVMSGFVAIVCWVVVCGFTVTYESATWVWATLGVALAVVPALRLRIQGVRPSSDTLSNVLLAPTKSAGPKSNVSSSAREEDEDLAPARSTKW